MFPRTQRCLTRRHKCEANSSQFVSARKSVSSGGGEPDPTTSRLFLLGLKPQPASQSISLKLGLYRSSDPNGFVLVLQLISQLSSHWGVPVKSCA